MSRSKILFKLSGSIACYKACTVISRLVQAGHEVQTVATRSALEFVGAATLEGLSGKPLLSEVFAHGRAMDHINLDKWADLVVLCPASANTINKLAAGIGDDLVSTLFLAHDFKKPYLVLPAMNTRMYQHPATQASIASLKAWNVQVLETASGVLACGDEGEGRLLEPELILREIEARLSPLPTNSSVATPAPVNALRVLVTAGGTREPIDNVRAIANSSTGRTAATLADALQSAGHKVTFVHARDSVLPHAQASMRLMSFTSFDDLDRALQNMLRNNHYDAVIHAAAVSDYSVQSVKADGADVEASEKIDSHASALSLELKPNPKLLPMLKSYSKNPRVVVVGFKLTSNASADERLTAVRKIAGGIDLVVHNDVRDIKASSHSATLYQSDQAVAQVENKEQLAQEIVKFISGQFSSEVHV